jgi:6-phosphogluconolactonase
MFKPIRKILGLLCIASLCFRAAFAGEEPGVNNVPAKKATLVYVGTFTGTPANSKGIYLYSLTSAVNELKFAPLGVAAETPMPAFLALDAKRRLLFCANEIDTFEGKPNGAVSAFSIDPATGKLKLINQQPSMGTHPCHIVLDKTGKNVIVANYNSGSVAVFPVSADGHIGEATCVIQDTGKSVNPDRQAGPHAHCVTLSPDNRFAFVCDLGIDKVLMYKFDAELGKLIPNDPPFVPVKPGSGPRHMTFSPNGKFACLICEMASIVTTFAYDAKAGTLKELQTVSCLPASFQGVNTAAEIAIEPSGKYLFASNRGDNSVAQFKIDGKRGMLTRLGEQNTGGTTPRFFAVGPSRKNLVICNQTSDTVTVSQMDSAGNLTPVTVLANVPAPVCTVFLPGEARP